MAGNSKRHHSKRRKDPTGGFPWTSKEARIFQSTDTALNYQSEYTVSYKPQPLRTRKSTRPSQKSITKKEEVKQVYVKPTTKLQAKTIYTQNFPEYSTKQVENCTVKSCKPVHEFSEQSTTFKGSSIYKTSYPQYDQELAQKCRSKAVRPSGNLYTPIYGEGDVVNSTLKEDLKPYPAITPPKPIIPSGSNIKIDGILEDCTIYTKTYVPHTVEPIVLAQAPRRTNSQTNVPFIAITTNMADYVNHGAIARDPCFHPVDNYSSLKTGTGFQGESTNSAAYKAWPVQQRCVPTWGREKEYKKNPAKLITNTTYSADYTNPGVLEMAKACRPSVDKDAIIRQNGRSKYRMQSTYDASFQAWEGARPAELCITQDNLYCSADKMDTSSTQQSHYKGEQTKRAALSRRISQHRELDSQRKKSTFNTTYREAFKGHYYIGSVPGADSPSRPVNPTPDSKPIFA